MIQRLERRHRALSATVLLAWTAVACGTASTTPPAQPDPSVPLADPIPTEPVRSSLRLTLAEVARFPSSSPVPAPTDPRLVRAARINYLGELPDGSRRLFVPDLNGKLYLLLGGVPAVYLDVAAEVGPDFWSHQGMGSGFGFVAFHPDFARNGLFYTVHTEARDALTNKRPDLPSQVSPSLHGVLTEWRANDPSADVFRGTRREVMRLGFRTHIHGFQQIDFDPADPALLYLAVGDGGAGVSSNDPQDLGLPHGKILRIDPGGTSGPNGKYGIPPTNPFVSRSGALGEIYAYGLRNPHRFSWDTSPSRMFVGNIGEHNIESIYEVAAGANFGWPRREGPFALVSGDATCSVYPLPGDDRTFGYTYPVAAYDHDPPAGFPRCRDIGKAVIGGFVYRGAALPALTGKYLLGDDVNGRIFYAEVREMGRGRDLARLHEPGLVDVAGQTVTMQQLAGDPRVDLRFGRDRSGELYVLSKANAKIWKLTAAR